VASHAAWFDTVNQFHGADATGELAWSIRVDGVFSGRVSGDDPGADGAPLGRPGALGGQPSGLAVGARS
jgi:hypothetical protein